MSLREAARQAGLDPSHLLRVERGTRGLSLPAALRLARVLKLRTLERQLEPLVATKAFTDGRKDTTEG
jgi:transcriptional regulator with XRE-family HTH domain